MTTTEQFIGTGSLMTQGCRPGMAHGMSTISGAWVQAGEQPSLTFVNYDPSGVLMSTAGSDLAYDVGTGSILMCVGGPSSQDWIALAST